MIAKNRHTDSSSLKFSYRVHEALQILSREPRAKSSAYSRPSRPGSEYLRRSTSIAMPMPRHAHRLDAVGPVERLEVVQQRLMIRRRSSRRVASDRPAERLSFSSGMRASLCTARSCAATPRLISTTSSRSSHTVSSERLDRRDRARPITRRIAERRGDDPGARRKAADFAFSSLITAAAAPSFSDRRSAVHDALLEYGFSERASPACAARVHRPWRHSSGTRSRLPRDRGLVRRTVTGRSPCRSARFLRGHRACLGDERPSSCARG